MKGCITLSIVLFLVGMLLAPSVAHAAGPCTIATFTANNWVFSVQGVVTQTLDEYVKYEQGGGAVTFTSEVDYDDAGVITPNDTTGFFTFKDTENLGNQSAQQQRLGKITVYSDCTVSFTLYSSGVRGVVYYNGIFRNNNTVIDIVSADSGFTVRGTVTLFTPPSPCSLATLNGPFAYTLGGSIGFQSQLFGNFWQETWATDPSFAAVGKLVFDGNGNLTNSSTVSIGGAITQYAQNYTNLGRYRLNPDCTGFLSIFSNVAPVNYNIIVVNNGKELRLVSTDFGVAISGSATP